MYVKSVIIPMNLLLSIRQCFQQAPPSPHIRPIRKIYNIFQKRRVGNPYWHLRTHLGSTVTSVPLPLAIEGVKDKDGKTDQQADQ